MTNINGANGIQSSPTQKAHKTTVPLEVCSFSVAQKNAVACQEYHVAFHVFSQLLRHLQRQRMRHYCIAGIIRGDVVP